MRHLLSGLVALFYASNILAATYYVDANGRDTDDGLSPGTAWQTTANISTRAFNPGDSILFKRGQTFLNSPRIRPISSGTEASPITYGAYGTGSRPILSGARSSAVEELSWTLSSAEAHVYYLSKGGNDPGIIDKATPYNAWRLFKQSDRTDLVGHFCDGGTEDGRVCFPNVAGSATSFDHCPQTDILCVKATLGSLRNGQWAYGDQDNLGFDTIYLRSDSGLPGHVLIPQSANLFDIGDTSWVRIERLIIEMATTSALRAIPVQSGTGYIVDHTDFRYNGAQGIKVEGADIEGFDHNVVVTKSRFHNNAVEGLAVVGRYHNFSTEGILPRQNSGLLVDNCEFDKNGLNGVTLFWMRDFEIKYSRMHDNYNKGVVFDGTGWDTDADGQTNIGNGCSNGKVHHNIAYNNGSAGILYEHYCFGNDLHHNLVYNNGIIHPASSNLAVTQTCHDNVIRYNVVVPAPVGGADAIAVKYAGDGPQQSTGNIVVHNTVDRIGGVGGIGINLNNPTAGIVKNNVIIGAGFRNMQIILMGVGQIDYNIWNHVNVSWLQATYTLQAWRSAFGWDLNTIHVSTSGYNIGAFQLNDPGAPYFDYTPRAASPVGVGGTGLSPTLYTDGDFFGRPVNPLSPTRGAFQKVASLAVPQEASPLHDLRAARGTSTAVDVTYSDADCASDHTVYVGDLTTILDGIDWAQRFCGMGNDGTLTFDPGTNASLYFVVVGNDGWLEGSYGQGSFGERPAAGPGGSCTYVQHLGGSCP